MNRAYREEYLAFRQTYEQYFCEADRGCREERNGEKEDGEEAGDNCQEDIRPLGDRFYIRSRAGKGADPRAARARRYRLTDLQGNTIHTWTTLDDDGDFCSLVCLEEHSGDQECSNEGSEGFADTDSARKKEYLIFREDLYGYSVFEMESGKSMQYLPAEAFPLDGEKFSETFIWTEVYFEPKSRILAVGGCFWACPFDIMVLDFSHPMEPQEVWLNVHQLVDEAYEIYDDIEFAGFEDGKLLLEGFCTETSQKEALKLELAGLKEQLEEAENGLTASAGTKTDKEV